MYVVKFAGTEIARGEDLETAKAEAEAWRRDIGGHWSAAEPSPIQWEETVKSVGGLFSIEPATGVLGT